eukprot:433439-Amphidinium_carterae.1
MFPHFVLGESSLLFLGMKLAMVGNGNSSTPTKSLACRSLEDGGADMKSECACNQEDHMRMYFSSHDISWALRNRIWTFLEKYRREDNFYIQEFTVQLIPHLPRALVAELRAEVYMPILTAHPFFSTYSCSDAEKQAMHLIIEKKVVSGLSLATEHELFVEGAECKEMYFMVQGRIGYYMGSSFDDMDINVDHQTSEESNFSTDDDGTLQATVVPGQWMCEPALWLDWRCCGWARAWNN